MNLIFIKKCLRTNLKHLYGIIFITIIQHVHLIYFLLNLFLYTFLKSQCG